MDTWELETASLTDNYQSLEVAIIDADGEVTGEYMPVVPVTHSEELLIIMIPHEFATWMPPILVPLADGDGGISADGQMITGAYLTLAAGAGAALVPSSGQASWVADGRWPAARPVVEGSRNVAEQITMQQVVMMRTFSDPAMPPTDVTLSPMQINQMFYGGLENGPWSGLM